MKLTELVENESDRHYGERDWDEKTKTSNPNLPPEERGIIAANAGMGGVSLDWNPETEEYNPYPKGSTEFDEYEQAYSDTSAYLRKTFPHA